MKIKEEGHKVAKAQSGKGKEKNSVPMCLCASVPDKRGFTLIELMAVIAIILILASIMIPNVVKNVERGREAKAVADIDILVKAVSLFQIDNGELPVDLVNLWDSGVGGPYMSSSKEDLLKTPWHKEYGYEKDDSSFTVSAVGKNKTVSKTITFQ